MNSTVLIIDTSSDAVCVCVGNSFDQATNIVMNEKSRHGENLFEAISKALLAQSKSLNEIDVIGVGIGPGSFTGLRIGIIAAHSFAHALSIPIVYFSSLELIALSEMTGHSAEDGPSIGTSIEVVKDARRKEHYYAKFESRKFDKARLINIDGVEIATILIRIESEQLIPQGEIEENIYDHELCPAGAIELVQKACVAEIFANNFAAQAIYIRKSYAELSWNIKK